MKKTISYILLLALVLSMAIPASAVSSAGGSAGDLTPPVVTPNTPAAPEEPEEPAVPGAPGVVTAPSEDFVITTDTANTNAPVIVPEEKIESLPQEKQETYGKAQETLTEAPKVLAALEAAEAEAAGQAGQEGAAPKEMVVKYFFYFQAEEPCTATFPAEGHKKVVYMQYVDEEWVKLETVMNEDDTVTVSGITEGPIAVLVEDENIYLLAADSQEYGIVSMEEVEDLPAQTQATLAEAKDNLEAAVPDDMAVRYFFHFSTEEPCSALFSAENFENVIYVQYVDGQWIELETEVNEDGTITVQGIVDGPMAVFVQQGE